MGVTGQAAAGWSLTDGMTLWGIGYFCEYGVGCRTGYSREYGIGRRTGYSCEYGVGRRTGYSRLRGKDGMGWE